MLLLLRPASEKSPNLVIGCHRLSACFPARNTSLYVAGCMPFGYGEKSAALYAPVGDSHERCSSHDLDKEHVKYIVHRIPNRVEPVSPAVKQCGGMPRDDEDSSQCESAVPPSIGKHKVGRTGSMRRCTSWTDSRAH